MIIAPRLNGREKEFTAFCRWLSKCCMTNSTADVPLDVATAREKVRSLVSDLPNEGEIRLLLACSIVLDMVARGWEVSLRNKRVELLPPSLDAASSVEKKAHVRRGHLLERNTQLQEQSVREFIGRMEQRRLGPRGWHSIFSVMRDGRFLAVELKAGAAALTEDERVQSLRTSISPYVQLVDADAVCEHTGLKLIEIWRYFRHTWVNAYKSLPGRSMPILVRDAAAPNHPVIGIAALGSSMAQQRLRDEWIGWEPDIFLEKLLKNDRRSRDWILRSVERLIDAIYIKDFVRTGLLSNGLIARPNRRIIERLFDAAGEAIQHHRVSPHAASHKANADSEAVDWVAQASTPLFRSKRAKTLAKLLQIRLTLLESGIDRGVSIEAALKSAPFRSALSQLVRMVKAEHVGVDMMDIVVCGAIAPYNVLLGGKLVCLLLASPEVVEFYRERYEGRASVIASSMKGDDVVRKPNLVLLATTSLYGVGSSQYNRLRVPLELVGGQAGERLEYVELGASRGYGSSQFSQVTLTYLGTLLGRLDGQKVNSIFGEGVNPLMRKIRDGLAEIGLPSDELLQHGNRRVVYGVPLARNFREVLLGLDENAKYVLPTRRPRATSDALASFWIKRWLAKRIKNPEVLLEVARHALTYPISHGARVPHQFHDDDLFD